jgi:hypothetical protein
MQQAGRVTTVDPGFSLDRALIGADLLQKLEV